MKKLSKTNEFNGYRIMPANGYYIVVIGDEKANALVTYEYDSACGTIEEVEEELKKYSFNTIRKRYAERYVYCNCVEPIY